jgi:hypothetical protein
MGAIAGTARDPASVRAAIARASQATGVDFSYLLAQAKLESGLNPGARAPTSSAAGLYQFTRSTWLRTLDRHGAEHGLEGAAGAIESGRVADPSTRSQLLALRYDPDASAMMAAELASDNRAELSGALGREPDAAELYMGHFLGTAGATTFLTALASDPERSAASVLPQAAAANRAIFYGPGGARSLGQVMDLIRGRVDAAMQDSGGPPPGPGFEMVLQQARQEGPLAQEFHAAQAQVPPVPQVRSRSMADTLAASFGGEGGAPASVRSAYAKLARFGL